MGWFGLGLDCFTVNPVILEADRSDGSLGRSNGGGFWPGRPNLQQAVRTVCKLVLGILPSRPNAP